VIKNNNLNNKIIIFGNGFSGSYLIKKALAFSSNIFVISRFPLKQEIENVTFLDFNDVEIVSKQLNDSIVISTVSPDNNGQDPVLAKYNFFFKSSNSYFGYISSTSVYGEGTLFEDSKTEPNSQRGKNRVIVEKEWLKICKSIKIFRSGGIYGQHRHPMIKYLNGNSEVITKINHYANRIHVEDLANIILLSLIKKIPSKIINLTDQNAMSAIEAISFVAEYLKLNKPIPINYKEANISEMAKSFFNTSRIIRSKVINNELDYIFLYPDYKLALLKLTNELIEIRKREFK
jgi:nucleoside-diphosphate-sugar epimerase